MRFAQLTVAVIAALGLSSAMAADEVVKFTIQGGVAAGKASTRDKIGDDIALYFGSQKTPAVEKKIGEWDSNRTSSRRSQQERCEIAFASAIIALQNRARTEGGNAVINITSGGGESSTSEFTCTSGRAMARVRLKGTVVKLKK